MCFRIHDGTRYMFSQGYIMQCLVPNHLAWDEIIYHLFAYMIGLLLYVIVALPGYNQLFSYTMSCQAMQTEQ